MKYKGKLVHKECKTELHFHQMQGMRLYNEVKGKKVYEAYCPTCKLYYPCDSNGNKITV